MIVYNACERVVRARLGSTNVPLGVLDSAQLNPITVRVEVEAGDRVVAYSEGLLEASGPDGEQFGEARLDEVLGCSAAPEMLFARLNADLHTHRASC